MDQQDNGWNEGIARARQAVEDAFDREMDRLRFRYSDNLPSYDGEMRRVIVERLHAQRDEIIAKTKTRLWIG